MTYLDEAGTGGVMPRLISAARYSISATLVSRNQWTTSLVSALNGIDRSEAGPTVRLLSTVRACRTIGGELQRLRRKGFEIRLVAGDVQETLILDGKVGLLSPPDGESGDVVLARDPAVVRGTDLLVAGVWRGAERFENHVQWVNRVVADSAQRILGGLCAGHTDEVAAREIKVSLRTYRRHVAYLMQDMQAKSRFQAGVRAVELGLLSANGSAQPAVRG